MEIRPKQLTLLFLTVAAAAMGISGQAPVILDDTRRTVYVPFGTEVLNLNCSLNMEEYERFRVIWYFNTRPFVNVTDILESKMFNRSAKTTTKISNTEETSWKHALNATKKSGWYFCEVTVEIPFFRINRSNGTQVLISKIMEHTTYPPQPIVTGNPATVPPTKNFQLNDWLLWIMLGVAAVILIVLLVICVLLRRRCRRSRAEDPVYANTRPVAIKQPSPRPEMDKLKSVSSSQNLRNPSPKRYDEGKRRHKQ